MRRPVSKPSVLGRKFAVSAIVVSTVVLSLVRGAYPVPGNIRLVSTSDAGVKANNGGSFALTSADGTKVAFLSSATNLDPGDTDTTADIYVKNLTTGDITLASTSDTGVKGNGRTNNPSLSGDGTKVAFESFATNLDPGDTDATADIYVKDLTTGEITLASTSDAGAKSNGSSFEPALSGDGTKVAFQSSATNLDPGDTVVVADIYVKDLITGDITLASTSDFGVKGNAAAFLPAMSGDGTRVAFESNSNNLDPADTDFTVDIYVKNLTSGDVMLASRSDAGVKGNGASRGASLSSTGTKVAFKSEATNLDAADADTTLDVYVKDLAGGDITLASTSDTGTKGNGNSPSPDQFRPALSADGTKVAFHSFATNLDPADTGPTEDVYVKDLGTGDIALASTSDTGTKGNGRSLVPTLSADGTKVGFASGSTNLDPADAGSGDDVYLKNLVAAPEAADISLTKTDSPDPVTVGNNLTYTLTVTNSGPDAAADVTITDPLPPDVNFVSAGVGCTNASGTVTCAIGSLVDGASAGRAVIVTPTAPNPSLSNTATASATTADPDSADNTATATTVVNVNAVPAASDDQLSVAEDAPGTPVDVLANDSDPDGDPLTISAAADPANGTAVIDDRGTPQPSDDRIVYTPDADYSGDDSFTYSIGDGRGGVDDATVRVSVTPVNDSPVARNDVYSVNEDGTLSIPVLGGVLANDSDVDSAGLTAVQVLGAAQGSLALNADGSFIYAPNPNFHGSDSFSYKANDGAGDSAPATVTITVNPVNDAPVAQSQSVDTTQETATPITLAATDVDSASLTYSIVSGPSHGTLSGAGASRDYMPAPGYNGPDSFTFKANDGSADSNVAIVSIAVGAGQPRTPRSDAPNVALDNWPGFRLQLNRHTDCPGGTCTILRQRLVNRDIVQKRTFSQVYGNLNDGSMKSRGCPVANGSARRSWEVGFPIVSVRCFGESGNSHNRWLTQGIAGSHEYRTGASPGATWLVVSWCYRGGGSRCTGATEIRSRITIVGLSGRGDEKFRHIGLSRPTCNPDTGNCAAKPLGAHAGGAAVAGKWLYVADTDRIFVFDLNFFFAGDGEYRLPLDHWFLVRDVGGPSGARTTKTGAYVSSLSVDGNGSLVIAQYLDTNHDALVARFPLASDGRLSVSDGRAYSSAVFTIDKDSDINKAQGVASAGGTFLFATSGETLERARPNTVRREYDKCIRWGQNQAQDLYASPAKNVLWGINEYPADRTIWSVNYRYAFGFTTVAEVTCNGTQIEP